MKNKIIILGYLIGVLMLGSCKKILEQNPTDQLSSATFWKSKPDFDMALASSYNTLQDYHLSSGIQDLEGLSDNGLDLFSYGNEETINQDITVSSHATDFWYYDGYRRLARYNIFLKELAGYNGSDMSSSEKLNYEAQVRLLRAWEYYRLYTFYGSVPLLTEPLTLATQNVPKAPDSTIFNQIISDCDFAAANLPDVTFWASQGHFVKAAAELLEARAYLYVAYDAAGNAKPDVMNKAVSLTSAIINSNLFNLGNYYRGLFAHSLGQQEGNPEYIFAVNFLAPGNSKLGQYGFNVTTMQFYWNSVHALPSLLDTYEFADGTPYNPADPRVNKDYLYINRDPRMTQTVVKDSVHWEDGTTEPISTGNSSGLPYIYWKVCDQGEVKQNGGTTNQKQNTQNTAFIPLMRYAELLLSHAEAVNEVSGPTTEVYNDINTIRARVKMPPLPTGLNKDQMRDRIRNERRVELAFEGFRYLDLKRWKIAPQVLNGLNDGIVTRRFEAPKNYLWPLPEGELLINTALKQNPDYQ